jgi:hypothetical protein
VSRFLRRIRVWLDSLDTSGVVVQLVRCGSGVVRAPRLRPLRVLVAPLVASVVLPVTVARWGSCSYDNSVAYIVLLWVLCLDLFPLDSEIVRAFLRIS